MKLGEKWYNFVMKKQNKAVAIIKLFLIALILAAGVSYISAWTGPTAPAPGNNVDAPINVGYDSQSKLGQLFLNTSPSNPYAVGLSVFGTSIFNGPVQIADGTQGSGKVLTSDASGTASWQAPAGGSGSNTIVYVNPVILATINTSGSWSTVSLAADGVPSTASAVILATNIDANNQLNDVGIYMRTNSSSPTYKLAGTKTSGGGAPTLSGFNQGIYPISSSRTFDYEADGGTSGSTITLVGYIVGTGPMSTVYVGGVTSFTAGGNITVSSTGPNGTGNVTVNTTATQSSGTVGGGCVGSTDWGNATVTSGGFCTCPPGYSSPAQQIAAAVGSVDFNHDTTAGTASYLCLKN
jgi:hypothetical protein